MPRCANQTTSLAVNVAQLLAAEMYILEAYGHEDEDVDPFPACLSRCQKNKYSVLALMKPDSR